jgi:phosphomannomutase
MKKIYAFDVDGTLTPSRLHIDKEFRDFFLKFMQTNDVYLVTGSDKEKTIEQVGEEVWMKCKGCLQSAGNHVFVDGKEVYRNDWEPTIKLRERLEFFLKNTQYPYKTSTHMEKRVGMVNFSTVGRDVDHEGRDAYEEWDKINGERADMVSSINKSFPELEASAGGQISIDIHPKGANKSQAKEWILGRYNEDVQIVFFGDKTMEGGNDYPIAEVLTEPHIVKQVESWEETYELLKQE